MFSTNDIIGQSLKLEGHVEGDQWCGRYWFFGGGTTFGGFKTKWLAAMWVLIRNIQLGEGWDG